MSNVAKAATAAAACMLMASLSSYLHYMVRPDRPWEFAVPLLVFLPSVALALLVWRNIASRLAALVSMEALSFLTAMWIAIAVFNDGL